MKVVVDSALVATSATVPTLARSKRIDPVFLPRPLLFVDSLPRNDTGKLPHEALLSLATNAMKRA